MIDNSPLFSKINILITDLVKSKIPKMSNEDLLVNHLYQNTKILKKEKN